MENNQAGIELRDVRLMWPIKISCAKSCVTCNGLDINCTYATILKIPTWLSPAFEDYPVVCSEEGPEYCVYSPIDRNLELITVVQWIERYFWFSNWYNLVINDGIKTPISSFFLLSDIINDNRVIDNFISDMPNSKAFVRLDTMSSKISKAVHNVSDIIKDFKSSNRTEPVYTKALNGNLESLNHKVVLREFVENMETEYFEVRCFVHDSVLRGVCGPYLHKITDTSILGYSKSQLTFCFEIYKLTMKKFVGRVITASEYDCCVVDVAIRIHDFVSFLHECIAHLCHNSNISIYGDVCAQLIEGLYTKMALVEINTPTWLSATSGMFSLQLPIHREILFGELQPEYFRYPRIITSYYNSNFVADENDANILSTSGDTVYYEF
jgi:hypothetical protein